MISLLIRCLVDCNSIIKGLTETVIFGKYLRRKSSWFFDDTYARFARTLYNRNTKGYVCQHSTEKKYYRVPKEHYAEIHVPNVIKKKAGNLTVLGIGDVHYYSVRKQSLAEGKTYTISDVRRALAIGQAQSDLEIGGKYAAPMFLTLPWVQDLWKH